MITEQERIIKKFEEQSLKYHKLSLTFHELAQSLRLKNKEIGENNLKRFKEYLKTLNIDVEGLKKISQEDIKVFKKDERGFN